MERNDRQLVSVEEISRAIRGDRAAVTTIVQAYLPRVYGLCFRIAGRHELAEEATQETFVRTLRALPKLRKPESFGSWILMIAANTTKEVLRVSIMESLDEGNLPAREENQDRGMEARKKAVEQAISVLGNDERALFLLHTVEGVSLDDLARDQETTPAAMKSRGHRIRMKVRESAARHLEEYGEAP